MKIKIVVELASESARTMVKALEIIAGVDGVTSVSVDYGRVTVVGDGLDSIKLTTLLRKKLGYAYLISVGYVGALKSNGEGIKLASQYVDSLEKQEKNISKQDEQYKLPDTKNRAVMSQHVSNTKSYTGSLSIVKSCISVVLKKIEACMIPEILQEMGITYPTSVPVFGYMKEIEKILFVIQACMVGEQLPRGVTFNVWLNQITEVVKDVDEVVDECARLIGETIEELSSDGDDCKVHDCLVCISEKVKEIISMLRNLLEFDQEISLAGKEQSRWLEHGSQNITSTVGAAHQLPSFANMEVDGEMIGREEERWMLQEWLTDWYPNRAVIAICGMGGMGKTTLARNFYMDKTIRISFDGHAWVSMSRDYRIGDSLRKIIHELAHIEKGNDADSNVSDCERLVKEICRYLKNRRYLLVLDDMWDKNLWLLLSNALSAMNTRSRVVITTRRKDVASLVDNRHVIYLQNLTAKEAQYLLYKRTFSDLQMAEDGPKGLMILAEDFLNTCEGWPLAIVSIASVLKNKIDEAEWTLFKNLLHDHIKNNPTLRRVVDVVSLSLNDLPSHLKNCFLHCSIVPVITRKWIIKLWAAECFIREVGNTKETMEEVAMQYIKELVNHCLLEVIDWNSNGEPKRLQMNKVVRVIALNMAVKEKFGTALTKDYCDELDCEIRRVSIWDCEDNLRLTEVPKLLRSFVLFGCKELKCSIIESLSSCRLLRVLCLRCTKITTLPSCVAELFNLHYLDLRHSEVEEIPESFENLQNLEVLDLRCRRPVRLPHGLEKLHKLRHLLLGSPLNFHHDLAKLPCEFYTKLPSHEFYTKLPYEFYRLFLGPSVSREFYNLVLRTSFSNDHFILSDTYALKYLQTLKGVVVIEDAFYLANLKQLRSLSVIVPGIYGYDLQMWDSIKQLSRLTSLEIVYEEFGILPYLGTHLNLAKLHLEGRIIKMPSRFFSAFPKLNVLKMTDSELKRDPLPFFSGLANLVELCLDNAYRGSNLTFRKGWFQKLKFLVLAEMELPISICIEEGTMRSLHTLQLSYIKQVKEVPKGLRYLESLSKLFIWKVPQVSEEKLQVLYHGAHNVPKIYLL